SDRAQGVSRRHSRRARFDRRRRRRRTDRRGRGEHRRRLPRPLRWRRHQGLRAVCAHDLDADVQAVRAVRHARDRARVTGKERVNVMLHRESGVFKTSYAADMALYPLPIARWTVAAIVLLFAVVLPASLDEYYLSVINLVLIAIVGALGLNIL